MALMIGSYISLAREMVLDVLRDELQVTPASTWGAFCRWRKRQTADVKTALREHINTTVDRLFKLTPAAWERHVMAYMGGERGDVAHPITAVTDLPLIEVFLESMPNQQQRTSLMTVIQTVASESEEAV